MKERILEFQLLFLREWPDTLLKREFLLLHFIKRYKELKPGSEKSGECSLP